VVVCVLSFFTSLGTDGEFGHHDMQDSLLSKSAQVLTPLLAPMDVKEDNWQASVGIITGLFAKEALVATFNSLCSSVLQAPTAPEPMPVLWQRALASISDNLQGIAADNPLGTDIGDVSSVEVAAQAQGIIPITLIK
jgi:ferrous iron transport protein B